MPFFIIEWVGRLDDAMHGSFSLLLMPMLLLDTIISLLSSSSLFCLFYVEITRSLLGLNELEIGE